MDPPQEPQNPRNWPQKIPQRGRTQLRNRRFAVLRQLIKEGEYFSEERMRLRAPRLFQRYIGRFRPPEPGPNPARARPEPGPNPARARPEPGIAPIGSGMGPIGPGMAPIGPGMGPIGSGMGPIGPGMAPIGPGMAPIGPGMAPIGPGIAGIGPGTGPGRPRELRELRERLLEALEPRDAEEEEEEEDEDEDEEQLPDEAERELLRLEFTSRMHLSFLEGLDRDFDYSQVDGQAELGALDLLSQDLEDRYFDEEEPGPAPPLL